MELDPELVVQLLSPQVLPVGFDQPPEIATGDKFIIFVRAPNIDVLTVELGAETEGLAPSDLILFIGDTEFGIE